MVGLCVVILAFVVTFAITTWTWQSEVSLGVVVAACAIAGFAFSSRRYGRRR